MRGLEILIQFIFIFNLLTPRRKIERFSNRTVQSKNQSLRRNQRKRSKGYSKILFSSKLLTGCMMLPILDGLFRYFLAVGTDSELIFLYSSRCLNENTNTGDQSILLPTLEQSYPCA